MKTLIFQKLEELESHVIIEVDNFYEDLIAQYTQYGGVGANPYATRLQECYQLQEAYKAAYNSAIAGVRSAINNYYTPGVAAARQRKEDIHMLKYAIHSKASKKIPGTPNYVPTDMRIFFNGNGALDSMVATPVTEMFEGCIVPTGNLDFATLDLTPTKLTSWATTLASAESVEHDARDSYRAGMATSSWDKIDPMIYEEGYEDEESERLSKTELGQIVWGDSFMYKVVKEFGYDTTPIEAGGTVMQIPSYIQI
ncbi:hypothetical protein EOM57_05015 [Candidatus Saccharibacteria bacterium]|nr:hypothetical protein [Candidatus Saccharibacteria bacterium]